MRNLGASEAVGMNGKGGMDEFDSGSDAVVIDLRDPVIDLRDPSVADGLASMLDKVSEFGERAGAAEAKAEVAFQDRLAVTGRLRSVTDELEYELAERRRLEVDNAELRRENDVRLEQLAILEARVDAAERREAESRSNLDELASATDEVIAWLQNELARTKKAKHILEALVSKRRLRHYEHLVRTGEAPGTSEQTSEQ